MDHSPAGALRGRLRAPGARRPHSRAALFADFGADRFRTALTRACTGAGVPTFSPHDLRHRRVSLLHLAGMPWARIGELVGHGDLMTTARTYTHVVADEAELDYAEVLPMTREETL
jgi:integrase